MATHRTIASWVLKNCAGLFTPTARVGTTGPFTHFAVNIAIFDVAGFFVS
jgi:hypothetical protein